MPRPLQPVLARAAREFPAVVLTGPHQSGKTALPRHLYGRLHRYVSLELPDVRAAAGALEALWPPLLRGGFPEPAAEPDRDARLWQASYIQTNLERDVRALRQVGDLTLFQNFLRALAARSGQLLNLSDIVRDLGAPVGPGWLVLRVTRNCRSAPACARCRWPNSKGCRWLRVGGAFDGGGLGRRGQSRRRGIGLVDGGRRGAENGLIAGNFAAA